MTKEVTRDAEVITITRHGIRHINVRPILRVNTDDGAILLGVIYFFSHTHTPDMANPLYYLVIVLL